MNIIMRCIEHKTILFKNPVTVYLIEFASDAKNISNHALN